MNALSIFRRHPNRYEVLFFAALALTVPTYYVGYEFASSSRILAICGLITFVASARMALHCLAYPKPGGNFFMPLYDWWEKVSQPAHIGLFEGKSVLERWEVCDFRSIYDNNGRLIATEQTINWSDTDPDWRPRDPEDIQIIVRRYDGSERLPWIARLRSPKLPSGNMAEIIDHNNNVVGHTSYCER